MILVKFLKTGFFWVVIPNAAPNICLERVLWWVSQNTTSCTLKWQWRLRVCGVICEALRKTSDGHSGNVFTFRLSCLCLPLWMRASDILHRHCAIFNICKGVVAMKTLKKPGKYYWFLFREIILIWTTNKAQGYILNCK